MGNSWSCSRCRKLNPADELTCDCRPSSCNHYWELDFVMNSLHCGLCGANTKLDTEIIEKLGVKVEELR